MDLFEMIFGSLKPYLFDILRITLLFTLFKHSIVLIRSKNGHSSTGGNPYSGATTALIGYLLG
ncbi:MAG TPA: hypothetical protein VK982_00635, partial [Bacteroidales bacterium]|nr:hypothetical protein [Bacteroidales bacterium]